MTPNNDADAQAISAALQRFLDGRAGPFESTVDNLVRVRVDASMRLLGVELLDDCVDAGRRRAIEVALVAAVNAALQKAALAAAGALGELGQHVNVPSPGGKAAP